MDTGLNKASALISWQLFAQIQMILIQGLYLPQHIAPNLHLKRRFRLSHCLQKLSLFLRRQAFGDDRTKDTQSSLVFVILRFETFQALLKRCNLFFSHQNLL